MGDYAAPNDTGLPCCPEGSKNCIHTSWTLLEPMDKATFAKAMLEILLTYPQEGQAGIDKGGWKIVEGDLLETGKISLEFRCRLSLASFLLNCGSPFVDDVQISIVAPTKVELRSSSRIGSADFGVNRRRLLFLGQKARDLGWDVPEPNY
jgi:Protein of unknown function (DUF1499)